MLAERLGEFLDRLLKQTQQPIRLLAHSMGGLVVRACIHKRRSVMDALMKRDGARLVMLGTPNQGAHSMVENLLGKGSTLRTLVRLDLKHDMQQVLDIVAGFRGALQLLPKPGFKDIFQGQTDGGELVRLPEGRRPGSSFKRQGARLLVRRRQVRQALAGRARRGELAVGRRRRGARRRCRPSTRRRPPTSSASHATRPAACARNEAAG